MNRKLTAEERSHIETQIAQIGAQWREKLLMRLEDDKAAASVAELY